MGNFMIFSYDYLKKMENSRHVLLFPSYYFELQMMHMEISKRLNSHKQKIDHNNKSRFGFNVESRASLGKIKYTEGFDNDKN